MTEKRKSKLIQLRHKYLLGPYLIHNAGTERFLVFLSLQNLLLNCTWTENKLIILTPDSNPGGQSFTKRHTGRGQGCWSDYISDSSKLIRTYSKCNEEKSKQLTEGQHPVDETLFLLSVSPHTRHGLFVVGRVPVRVEHDQPEQGCFRLLSENFSLTTFTLGQ